MEAFLNLFSPRDILFHVINTMILIAAVTYFVYKPVRKFLKGREDRIAGQMDEAAEKQRKADMCLADANAARKAAEADVAQSQKTGAVRAEEIADRMIQAAKKEADGIVAQAKADAAAVKAAAQEEIQEQALSMAVEIAERLIGRELSEKDNRVLAREFLTKVV